MAEGSPRELIERYSTREVLELLPNDWLATMPRTSATGASSISASRTGREAP